MDFRTTDDREEIKSWIEDRNGIPGMERGTGENGIYTVLGIKFSWNKNDILKEISWKEFFDKFEKYNLVFGFQEKTIRGTRSRYYKIHNR